MASRTRLAMAFSAGAVASLPAAVFASTYVVRPGDSLADIATRHGTTVDALQAANQLHGAGLQPGRLLTIPDQRVSLPPYTAGAEDVERHTVRPNQGMFEIARHYGVDATALARTNGVGVSTPLRAGVELLVPGRLSRVSALLSEVSQQVGVDGELVSAVGWVESRWRQERTSATGAVGIMQLEPYAGDWVSRHLAGRRLNVWKAGDNVTAGALLLAHLLRAHHGDIAAALAGYYQGDASVAQHGRYADTDRYVSAVTALLSPVPV